MTTDLTYEHLETFVFDPHRAAEDEVRAMARELIAARASLTAIKAADPALFDPRGGTSRGAAYETYGSAGHDLREKYLAAIGVTPEEDEDDDRP